MLLLGLKAMGVENVNMTDMLENRRRKALELGATEVWNPAEVKSPGRIKELTQGRGVDVAIEAVGVEATLKDCLASAKFQGMVIVQGIFTDRALVHMLGFVTRETTMIGTNSINPPLALEWLATGKIQPRATLRTSSPWRHRRKRPRGPGRQKRNPPIKILVAPKDEDRAFMTRLFLL
jgi:threonine dehydrogenase-like Zn-dependent dehydrogenase